MFVYFYLYQKFEVFYNIKMSDLSLVEGRPELPNGFAEVAQGEWKATKTDGLLGTLGVSSCLVIAVVNPRLRRGYLGHFSSPHSRHNGDRASFDDMIDQLKEIERDSLELKAWLSGTTLAGGNTETERIHDTDVLTDREYVFGRIITELVDEHSVDEQWLGTKQELSVITFNPAQTKPIKFNLQTFPASESK